MRAELLFLVTLLAVVAMTTLLSFAAYKMVEQPMIGAGGKLIRRWRSRNERRIEVAA